MNNEIHKIVYCSRNEIRGTDSQIIAEVQNILATARKNNAKAGITGALLFNEGLFAQVLEGPLSAIEKIFEAIQRDPRHSDVTVLHSGPAESRDFPAWSMAFTAVSSNSAVASAVPVFREAFANPPKAAVDVLSMLQELVIQEDWLMAS